MSVAFQRSITAREAKLLLQFAADVLVELSQDGRVEHAMAVDSKLVSSEVEQLIGRSFEEIGCRADPSEDPHTWDSCPIRPTLLGGGPGSGIHRVMIAAGSMPRIFDWVGLQGSGDPADGMLLVLRGVEDEPVNESRRLHDAKLDSIGQLAAGIAHEINTPAQFVLHNVNFLRDAFADVMPLLTTLVEAQMSSGKPAMDEKILSQLADTDLDFMLSEIPDALGQALDGLKGITSIVSAMKEFSHPGTGERQPVNLNSVVESALVVTRSEWKHHAQIELDLAPHLMDIAGYSDELGQVVLNVIINAAHAIEQTKSSDEDLGTISIATRLRGDMVELTISDTGPGIPDSIRARIFDPFFTTKEVGKGTGQGLAISRSVVVDKHHGTIEVENRSPRGATFIIRMPSVGSQSIGTE